jgi:polyisoprenoid-binding protein YceI
VSCGVALVLLVLGFGATESGAAGQIGDGVAIETWRIDAESALATFRVRLFKVLPLAGRFERISGSIAIDRAAGEVMVDATIRADSARMPNPAHDGWVQSDEFFDAAAHPEIRFRSQPFPIVALDRGGELPGTLTLRGIARDVTFAIEPSACDPMRSQRCDIEVRGQVSRSAFGMRSRPGTVSDRVYLRLVVSAERAG